MNKLRIKEKERDKRKKRIRNEQRGVDERYKKMRHKKQA